MRRIMSYFNSTISSNVFNKGKKLQDKGSLFFALGIVGIALSFITLVVGVATLNLPLCIFTLTVTTPLSILSLAEGSNLIEKGNKYIEDSKNYNRISIVGCDKNIPSNNVSINVSVKEKASQKTKLYEDVAEVVTEKLKRIPEINFAILAENNTSLTANKCRKSIIEVLKNYTDKNNIDITDIKNIKAFADKVVRYITESNAITNGNRLNQDAFITAIGSAVESRHQQEPIRSFQPFPTAINRNNDTTYVSRLYPDISREYQGGVNSQYNGSNPSFTRQNSRDNLFPLSPSVRRNSFSDNNTNPFSSGNNDLGRY